eukprot:72817-Alexandrium_andersonii.AAC.1
MSASLVGSEMCIRDRAKDRPQNVSLKLWRGGFCVPFHADAESADEAGRCCLLYTSDAADDM